MSARLLATLCLVLVCVPLSSAQSAASQDAELVVYLRTGGNQPAAPLAQMKRELGALMHQAGYRVEWRSLDANRGQDADASLLAVLDLTGVCGIAPGYAEAERAATISTSLATTTITDGQVLPFSSLNCAALTNSVSAALAKEAGCATRLSLRPRHGARGGARVLPRADAYYRTRPLGCRAQLLQHQRSVDRAL